MLSDYYKIFGLSKTTTKEEIKKRYRELAKKYHPDVNHSPDATARMQEILEAYYILSDDEARSRYDVHYDRVYANKKEDFKSSNARNQTQSDKTEQKSYEFDDPILEKWILNAKRQAVEFLKNFYKDTKGIAANGCSYYFKTLVICILIFIGILILISIFRAFKT